ncbi:hypothetical protein Tco_1146034 [Tanacetum coccineum]
MIHLLRRRKNTYSTTKEANLKNDLADLMGINVVEEYHKKKLLYDKYFDKMLKRRKSPKITNCDVLTKKGPITLKVYREDGTDEVISDFKTRIEYLNQTEKELKIDFNKPLKEQDPLNELNDLANKKRKRTGDLKDHSSGTKTEEEHQFNLVDNSKLNNVYILNRRLKQNVALLEGLQGGKKIDLCEKE